MPSQSVIDHDEDAQLAFAAKLLTFNDDVEALRKKLLEHCQDARDNMKDESGIKAVTELSDMAGEIRASLRGIEDFAGEQKLRAQAIKAAKERYV